MLSEAKTVLICIYLPQTATVPTSYELAGQLTHGPQLWECLCSELSTNSGSLLFSSSLSFSLSHLYVYEANS